MYTVIGTVSYYGERNTDKKTDKSVLNICVKCFFCGVSSSCICSVPSDEEKSPGKSPDCVGLRPTPG